MEFVLNGFSQPDEYVRRYVFEGIADDRKSRSDFAVRVDLALLSKHRIPLQEAPLLCRLLLAATAQPGQSVDLMLTEDDMLARVVERKAEAAASGSKRKSSPSAVAALQPIPIEPIFQPPSNGLRSGIGLGSTLPAVGD